MAYLCPRERREMKDRDCDRDLARMLHDDETRKNHSSENSGRETEPEEPETNLTRRHLQSTENCIHLFMPEMLT